MSSGRHGQQSGFTYVFALLLVALTGAGATAIAETWSHALQREKEAELQWVGEQFRRAIGLYYQRSPGAAKRYPERLEDLLEDRRFLAIQRYLRRVHPDPATGKADWVLVRASDGGIIGVRSSSRASNHTEREFIYKPERVPVYGPTRLPLL